MGSKRRAVFCITFFSVKKHVFFPFWMYLILSNLSVKGESFLGRFFGEKKYFFVKNIFRGQIVAKKTRFFHVLLKSENTLFSAFLNINTRL
jgi:hypothetical protein